MPLSSNHLKHVCLLAEYGWKQCRYLEVDDVDPSKMHCIKKSSRREHRDEIIEEYIKSCLAGGIDPRQVNGPFAISDNCPGYTISKYVEQGYDKNS